MSDVGIRIGDNQETNQMGQTSKAANLIIPEDGAQQRSRAAHT